MLGSHHDAEDVVQETLLRAWRGIARFEGRATLRTWLYRIATNACLDTLASRADARRFLPTDAGPPATEMPGDAPVTELPWLEPYPDTALEGIADTAVGPDARYEMRESVRLAFVAAIQILPPRQRAVLLLRDVLGWTAAESAKVLDASVASVNSALQRARRALDTRIAAEPAGASAAPGAPPSEAQRVLLERYVQAWERVDVNAFVALLREDAVFSMPPWPNWYRGRDAIGAFFTWTARPGGRAPFRLRLTAANAQPALAFYGRWSDAEWRAHSLQVLDLAGNEVVAMTSFVTPALFARFGLPEVLAG
jgi:RNA polymerase sigma-70 factor (ECF subfamily)